MFDRCFKSVLYWVSTFFIFFLFSSSLWSEVILPVDIKVNYSRDKDLCSMVLGEVTDSMRGKYQENLARNKSKNNIKLAWLTDETEMTSMSVTKWKEHQLTLVKPEKRIRLRKTEYIIEDINNDKTSDYVERHNDWNDLSGGYAWEVFPGYIPNEQLLISLNKIKQSRLFHFRENNVNLSKDGSRHAGNSQNFNFDFFSYKNHIYVLLRLHFGYFDGRSQGDGGQSGIFEESYIVADLDGGFKIAKQYCYFDISVDNHSGFLNF